MWFFVQKQGPGLNLEVEGIKGTNRFIKPS